MEQDHCSISHRTFDSGLFRWAAEERQTPITCAHREYPVGRTSLIWLDANRSKRPVKLDIWYRADPSGNLAGRYFPNLDALWTDKTTAGAISDRFGPALPGITQGTFFSNACDNARIAKSGRPFPLVLFSHGLGNSPYDYSIQLEDLVSHGYIVAAAEHIPDSLGVVMPDGRVVAFDRELWERYASASSPETIRYYEQRAIVWAEDLLFVLQKLHDLSIEKKSPFYGTIDLRRIGAFGHSLGGRSATTAVNPRLTDQSVPE